VGSSTASCWGLEVDLTSRHSPQTVSNGLACHRNDLEGPQRRQADENRVGQPRWGSFHLVLTDSTSKRVLLRLESIPLVVLKMHTHLSYGSLSGIVSQDGSVASMDPSPL
jgi:hypothetical protein